MLPRYISTVIVGLLIGLLSFSVSAQDSFHNPAEYLSGTLPVMYINTEGAQPIVSKIDYVSGLYYIDANGIDGYEDLGSADSPLSLLIRGRGNITWRAYDKKSYRLKFDKKASPLGMNKSKHFALLAHADDRLGLAKDEMGFELSRMLGMPFTPKQLPIEVVLNGDYVGLYFLCETIRVASDRVDIVEQDDLDDNPATVSGGWLLEFDNYAADEQIYFKDAGVGTARVTPHSPEVLSDVQRDYVTRLLLRTDSLIHVPNKFNNAWEDVVDVESFAKYYLIHEVMDNVESFSGSCYFYKDAGDDEKIYFGPVWDCGSAYGRTPNTFLYRNTPAFASNHWVSEVCKYPHFQDVVRTLWADIEPRLPELAAYTSAFVKTYQTAAQSDFRRWPQYQSDRVQNRVYTLNNRFLQGKAAFLSQLWNEGLARLSALNAIGINDKYYRVIDDLAIVTGINLTDSAFIFVTDNRGAWLRLGVDPAQFDNLMAFGSFDGRSLAGIYTGRSTLPTLTLSPSVEPLPAARTDNAYNLRMFNLDAPFTPELGEVVLLHGIYHEQQQDKNTNRCTLSGYDPINDTTLISIEVDPLMLGEYPLYDGLVYTLPAVIRRRAIVDGEQEYTAGTTDPMSQYVACLFGAPGLQTFTDSVERDVLTVAVDGRRLRVSAGKWPVTICDINGRCVPNGVDVAPGIYVVRAAGLSRKVVVR